jgi:hypothetical protein
MVVTAKGTLTRQEVEQPDGDATMNRRVATLTEELCTSEIAIYCLDLLYDTGCASFGFPDAMCLFNPDLQLCIDTTRCLGGVAAGGANFTGGDYTDDEYSDNYASFPAGVFVGTASTLMPGPPNEGWKGTFALGGTFEVEKSAFPRAGCSQRQRGVIDLLQFIEYCGTSEYASPINSGTSKVAIFNWIDPLFCYPSIRGPRSTGRCTMSFEFLHRSDVYNFTRSEVLFGGASVDMVFMSYAEQTDGTVFWSSNFGVVSTAQGILTPVTEASVLPEAPPPSRPLPDLPPGAIAGGIPLAMVGTFTGDLRNYLPTESFSTAEPYPVLVTVEANGDAAAVWDEVGRIEYLNPDGLVIVAPLLKMYAVECLGPIAGQSPTYQCFQFVEDHLAESATGTLDAAFEFQAISLSIQEDGSVYFAYHQGPVVTALGTLSKSGPEVQTTLAPSQLHTLRGKVAPDLKVHCDSFLRPLSLFRSSFHLVFPFHS